MENDPHQLIEGMLIAGLAVDRTSGYIYIRGEYRYLIEIMDKAIAEAYERGWLGKNIQGTRLRFRPLHAHRRGRLRVRRRIGAARIARRQARHSADLAAVSGRCRARGSARPLLNNVETYCAVPAIIRDGGAAFAALGTSEERRHATVLPLRPREQARRLRTAAGVQPDADDRRSRRRHAQRQEVEGGDSRRIVVPGADGRRVRRRPWITIPWRSARPCSGRAAWSSWTRTRAWCKLALRIMRFYAHESCGWCIPCREGTTWLRKMLPRFHEGGGREATSI